MEILTMEQINEGLRVNGGVAGFLPNMRQMNPTLAINKELNKLVEEAKEEKATQLIIENAIEEYRLSIPKLIYGKSYEGGIRYNEPIELINF